MLLAMLACDSDTQNSIDAGHSDELSAPMDQFNGQDATRDATVDGSDAFERCETYPDFNLVMGYNAVVPPIGWQQAYNGAGHVTPFSFEHFFCGSAYIEKTTLILVVGAGWCQSCTRLVQKHIDPIADNLIDDLDTELVYLEIQDAQYEPADGQFAYRHFNSLIADGPGWRVGDADTLIRDGEHMVPAPQFVARQDNLPVLPAVWVIRKRDMRIIATRELAMRARPGELPLKLIAMDPEQDWSEPPLPPFRSQCDPGDEEESEEQTNNVFEDATPMRVGTFTGGICDPEPDFYTVDLDGPWRVSLQHDTWQGDLDLVLWDTETNTAALGDDGRVIGSFTANDVETLVGSGPAVILIRGYGGASASYTLTLETLGD